MKQKWKKKFFTIYAGQIFSIIGSSAVQFAIIWWLTVKTNSAMTLTIATIAGFLPSALLGPFAGVWVDRFNRKTIMILSDGFVAVCSALVMLSFVFGEPSVNFIYLMLLLRAVGGVFHAPAMQSTMPMLVPAEEMVKAGGWAQLVQSGSAMLGPVIGAGLMGVLPMEWVMAVDVIGALIAVLILACVKIPNPPKAEHYENMLHSMKEGFHELIHNRAVMAVSIPLLLAMLIYVPIGSLFPLMISGHFQGTAFHASISELAFGGGMLLSSLMVGLLGGMKRRFFMISIFLGGFGASVLFSGLLPASGFWWFIVATLIMGITGNLFSIPFMTYIQVAIPPEKLGRVISLIMSIMSLSTPLGLLIAGPVTEAIGITSWFIISGAVMIAIAFLCYFMTRVHDKVQLSSPPPATESVIDEQS